MTTFSYIMPPAIVRSLAQKQTSSLRSSLYIVANVSSSFLYPHSGVIYFTFQPKVKENKQKLRTRQEK